MTQEHEQGTSATLVAVRNGPGARLRAAREANGFTQLEVAQQLRLNPEIIARLEEDNYDPTTPLVFIKGYLRSYAGVIGLDPEQILGEFTHLGIKDPVRDVPDLGHSPQRKLSSFNAGTPKHRPGLLWGSLALFACGMIAFMFAYRDQIPALSSSEASATTTTTTAPSTEEAELNAAIEAARKANAQAVTAETPTPTPTGATPATVGNNATATTPATAAPTATVSSTGTGTASSTPGAQSAGNTAAQTNAAPKKAPITSTSEDDDEDNARPVKPVSANRAKQVNHTHETMLF